MLELGLAIRSVLDRGIFGVVVVVIAMSVTIGLKGYPGLTGFSLISAGLCLCLLLWRRAGIGLPLLPVLAIQHFVVYGYPIFNHNETLADYPEALVNGAGMETFAFLATLGFAWFSGMQLIRPSRGFAHVITAFDRQGIAALRKVGIGLAVGSTVYGVLDYLKVSEAAFNLLPNGLSSIVNAAVGAATLAGFFLTSMLVGSGQASPTVRTLFTVAFIVNFAVSLTSLLLYTLLGLVGAVCVGFFWSAGRVPWKFLIIVLGLVAFLQIGKSDMRERYHFGSEGDPDVVGVPATLSSLPTFYGDWINFSVQNLVNDRRDAGGEKRRAHGTLEERIDNLQNLLFVMRAVVSEHVSPLGGSTYWIIPALLTPRIIWPEKPRTHEGQVMLNVHYGRQTEEETQTTYIAWGLLPEAYGNFGPIFGAVFLGCVLGFFCAWVESFTAFKPLLSVEGMCAFGFLVGIATSFEMVASVLVTSQFQAVVTTFMACLPFLRRMRVGSRPEDA
jgi:hypothetical protein